MTADYPHKPELSKVDLPAPFSPLSAHFCTTHHRPIQLLQNGTVIVTDANPVQFHHFVRSKIRIFVGQIDNTLLQFLKNGSGLFTEYASDCPHKMPAHTPHVPSSSPTLHLLNRHYVGNEMKVCHPTWKAQGRFARRRSRASCFQQIKQAVHG